MRGREAQRARAISPIGKGRLSIHRLHSPVRVLGPGSRAVIWVQGCSLGCPGCIADYARDRAEGAMMGTDEAARWLLAQGEIEGVTLSGGEPMEQAAPLAEVLDLVRAQRDLGVVCYTGYALEQLRASGDVGVAQLLERIDLLIDGPYLRERHRSLLWRASSNQRLLALTPRYSGIVEGLTPDTDRSAGVEFAVGQSGAVLYAGVPDTPDFNAEFAVALAKASGNSGPTQLRSHKPR